MTQRYRGTGLASPVHGTPVFISEPLSPARRSESVNKLITVSYSALTGTAWSNFQNLIIMTMHS